MSQTVYLKVHDGRHKALPSTILFMFFRPLADHMLQAHGHDSWLAETYHHCLLVAGPVMPTATPRCTPLQLIATGLDNGKEEPGPTRADHYNENPQRYTQTAISLSSASSSSSSLDLLGLAAWAGLVWGTLGRGGLACGWA